MCATTVAGDDYCPPLSSQVISTISGQSSAHWNAWPCIYAPHPLGPNDLLIFESVIRAPLKIYNFTRALTLAGWQRGISQNILNRRALFNLQSLQKYMCRMQAQIKQNKHLRVVDIVKTWQVAVWFQSVQLLLARDDQWPRLVAGCPPQIF